MSVCILLFDLSKHILQNCIWCTNLGLEIDNTIEIIISIKIIPLALSKPRLVISQVFHAYFICLAVKIETFILTLNIETEPGLGSNISERPFIFEKFKFFQFFLYSLLIVWVYWRTGVRKNYEQSQSLYIKIYKKKRRLKLWGKCIQTTSREDRNILHIKIFIALQYFYWLSLHLLCFLNL